MELKDIKEVLTFAAFRPEADNPKFTWPQRFPKRKSVLVNISRGHVSWCYLNKKGQIEDIGEADGEFAEIAGQMADNWASHTEDGWIGVSLNNRFIISLEHNLSRKKGWQEELRQSPKSILGTKYDRTKRYALHHSPETSASLMMACDDSIIKTIEETMRTRNLRSGRICVGLFAMLRPFIDAAEPSTRVLLMEDRNNGEFTKNYLSLFENLNVTDVTEEDALWNILGRN